MCSRMTKSGMAQRAGERRRTALTPPAPRRARSGRARGRSADGGSRHGAGIFLPGGLDQLKGLARRRHRLHQLEDVPLVLSVLLVLDLDHVHLLQQLMVPVAEHALASLEDVEGRALLE